MEVCLKIRGIYATALTRFFIEHDLTIVSPSKAIQERFMDYRRFQDYMIDSPDLVEISDLKDQQGILLKGDQAQRNFIVKLIRERFFDVICRETGFNLTEIEFPYPAKSALDELRNSVIPTVPNHHRLRLVASEYIDLMERIQLTNHPEKREVVGYDLEKRLIWEQFEKGKQIAIEHLKLDSKVIPLEGEIVKINPSEKRLTLQRRFSGGGKYDGLNLPIERGDYALTELRDGEWFYRHIYYRQDGNLIGEYYNINTPIEFYPDRIRYHDLEIDVIKWPDGKMKITDVKELDRFRESNCISKELADKAWTVAHEIKIKLYL